MTTNEQVALLPDASVNVMDTGVEPIGKASPGLRVLDLDSWVPELSVAVGRVQEARADDAP